MDHIDYYYSAMRHQQVITHPIKFKISSWEHGSAWTVSYRSVPEAATGVVVGLITIHDGTHKHCNGLIIDHTERTVSRIEPCTGPYEQMLQSIMEQWVRLLPMCSDYSVQHVTLNHPNRCVPSVIMYTHQYLSTKTWNLYTNDDIDKYFRDTIMVQYPLLQQNNSGTGYHGWGYGSPYHHNYYTPQYYHHQYHHPPRPSRRFPWGGVLLGALGGLLVGGLLTR